MTEAEWMACADPTPMLEFLLGKAGDRKLRLFAVACCRRIRPQIPSGWRPDEIEVVEHYADGMATERERGSVHGWNRSLAISNAACPSAYEAAYYAAGAAAAAYATADVRDVSQRSWSTARVAEQAAQATLLRDIFGNPFHPASLIPAWLAWNDGTVAKLAEGIRRFRAYYEMPLLADALEEAGCEDTRILLHLRTNRTDHTSRCWVLRGLAAAEAGRDGLRAI